MTDVEAATGPAASAESGSKRLRWWHEVIYIVLVYGAYSIVRNRFGSGIGDAVDPRPAFEHAEQVIGFERAMGLYFERALHRWYLDLPGHGLIRGWNVFYGVAHFVVTAAALIWAYRRSPGRYPLWRNTLAAMTLVALVGFASYSLMPPRLLDDPGAYGGCQLYSSSGVSDRSGDAPCDRFGFIDTVERYGGWASFGSDEMKAVSNQYAAMPSMHVGWATWSVLVVWPLLRRRWTRALVVLHPVATVWCIVVTANHYWIDGAAGLLCLGVGFALATWFASAPRPTWLRARR